MFFTNLLLHLAGYVGPFPPCHRCFCRCGRRRSSLFPLFFSFSRVGLLTSCPGRHTYFLCVRFSSVQRLLVLFVYYFTRSVFHIVGLIIIIVHSFSYSLIYGFRYVLAFRFEKRRILCLRRFLVKIWFFVFPSVVLSCGRPCHIFALSGSSSGRFFRYRFILKFLKYMVFHHFYSSVSPEVFKS